MDEEHKIRGRVGDLEQAQKSQERPPGGAQPSGSGEVSIRRVTPKQPAEQEEKGDTNGTDSDR